MPVYGSTPNLSVGLGETVTLWNAETPTPGTGTTAASQKVALVAMQGRQGFSITGKFSGAPGAFEIDVQVADVDADTNYQTCANGNITSVDATNNTFHFDGPTVTATFMRLLMRTRTNSVSVTSTISRM